MQESIPLWIDSDPSGFYYTGLDCDDDLAILIAMALHERRIKLEGLSICGGNAPLSHTWDDVQMLWKYVDGYQLTGMQPIKGYGWRSMQVAVKLLQFYNILFQDVHCSDDASRAISKRVLDATQQRSSMTILTLGPPTNVAKAIQIVEASAGSGIEHIYLMGGELTNQQLDLNFRSDRASARIVIEANIPKTIIPIQTCGQVLVTEEWISKLDCERNKELAVCAYLNKMRQQTRLMPVFVNPAVEKRMQTNNMQWKALPNLDRGFIPWDIVALLAITHPEEFDDWRYHRVSLPACGRGEPCDGTMQVLDDLGADFNGNWRNTVRVPHKVRNETRLLDIMLDLIKDVKVPASRKQPHMNWGFAPDLAGFVIATSAFVFYCITPRFRRR